MSEQALQGKARAHRSPQARRPAQRTDLPERRFANAAMALQASAGNAAVSKALSPGGGGGRPLPPILRREMEQRFAHDFERVRLHDDAAAAEAAAGISAKAFTIGDRIWFGAGRFAPETIAGKRLIAHELAHVIQQSRGGSPPALDPSSHLEKAARAASDAALAGAGPIAVGGASGIGVARDEENEKAKSGEEDEVANMTAIVQMHKQRQQSGVDLPVREINDPRKGAGVLGEVTVPFEHYRGWDWNHLGGGEETKSSRTSLARQTRYSREPSAGFDFLVENARTGRLVIGEQKNLKSGSFTRATATSGSLEKNLAHTVDVLKTQIASGKVHPDSVKGLEVTIGRLQATLQAVRNRTQLPEGVVFEFTNLGGKSKQIGKDYIDNLAKKYGDNPEFLDHLLSRTSVRDPQLAKSKGRDPGGMRGTDTDPDIVPAKDILTPDAADRLAQIKSGMTPREWSKHKKQQSEAAEAAEKAERKAKRDEKDAARKRAAEERVAARKRASEERAAEKKRLTGEKKAAARKRGAEEKKAQKGQSGEKKPARKKAAAEKPEAAGKQGKSTGKPRKQAPAGAAAPRKQATQPSIAPGEGDAGTAKQPATQKPAAKKPPGKRGKTQGGARTSKKAAGGKKAGGGAKPTANKAPAGQTKTAPTTPDPQAAQGKITPQAEATKSATAKKPAAVKPGAATKPDAPKQQPPPDTPASIKKLNTQAKADAALGKGAQIANKGAAAIRAYDAYDEAKKAGKGEAEAVAAAAKTYLDNTNIVFGAVANAEAKQRKGQDPVESWISTLGETGAGFAVPGKGWDQAVNAVNNLVGAAEDHANRNDPNARTDQASLATVTDAASQLTPSRMFSQTIGGGLRSYYNIGKLFGGDGSGVDRFGDDAVKGELGMIFQPWGMAADFLGNLGSGEGAERALYKTLDKSKGTTIEKLGSKSGDLFYELGQSDTAKSGEYGASVQGWAMISSVGADLIAGRSWEQALEHAAEPGKGGLLEKVGSATGDLAWTATEKTTEFINEDIPKAKQAIVETYAETKQAVAEKVDSVKETVSETAGQIKSEMAANYEGAKQKYENTKKFFHNLWE